MKIKVCGMREPANISAVAALKPDYMGFIFYPASPRYADDLPLDALQAMDPAIIKTGVFVNETRDKINALIERYKLCAIQLHGQESPEFCREFKGRVQVIKAFNVGEDFDFEQLKAYVPYVNYFLFDARTSQPGGSGQTFDWGILDKYLFDVPFFLSGGLSPVNLQTALSMPHAQFYGVDLNSKFETEPGIKNIPQLKRSFDLIRTKA